MLIALGEVREIIANVNCGENDRLGQGEMSSCGRAEVRWETPRPSVVFSRSGKSISQGRIAVSRASTPHQLVAADEEEWQYCTAFRFLQPVFLETSALAVVLPI